MEYLLTASAVIFIFYTCYKVFLQRETFFESNRWFLLIGLIFAILMPFIVIPVYIEYVPVVQQFIVANAGTASQTAIEDPIDFIQIVFLIYSIGALYFLVKFIIELSSLLLLLKKNSSYKKGAFTFIETHHKVPPFSFFKYIVYNKNQFNETELNHIINHEKVHAKQYHSIDIMLIHIASTLFWFNPFIWLYKKVLQQNLEFIADKEAQIVSKCEKSYQTLLLKSSVPNYQLVLANNFYNSLIKKRIVMLHKS
jgi:beta-lactamase regulating signal transducer with metallopeptidase domain